MFKIVIIEPNDVSFTETNISRAALSTENISDLCSEFTKLINVKTDDEFLGTIIDSIFGNKYENEAIHTASVSHINDDLYQMCHVMVTHDSYDKIKSKFAFNGIATYLTDANAPVFGPAVLFKINTTNNQNSLSSVTNITTTELFRTKFIHQGVIINTNETLDAFDFVFNPVDWINGNEISKYKFVETEILDKKMMIFYDTTQKINDEPEQNLNIIGTQLYGSPLYGRLIVALHDIPDEATEQYDNTKYIDLTIELMKKLIDLFIVKKQSTKMSDNEDVNHQIIKGKRIYNNFHKIVNQRI